MAINPTDYVPHGLVAALATVVGWVFRDHVKQDEKRFVYFGHSVEGINEKLDKAVATQASNHAEILRLLIGLEKK